MKKKNESKILVVDDDKYNLYILREMLSPYHEVILASDGASAVELARDANPDLIIQDIILPDVDGFELCRKLKNGISKNFVKLILVSAKSDLSDRLKGYECGADDYIIKPFEKEELLAKVNVFLRLKHVEEVERLKEDVINLFSHEVRTPLNAIAGFAELLESTSNLDKKQAELVNHIILNARDLLSLAEKSIFLNSMPDASQVEKNDKVSVTALIDEVLKSREIALIRKRLRLIKNIDSDVSLNCNSKLIFEAVCALLDNAIKFSSAGSAVFLSSSRENGYLLFVVRDQGGGFLNDFNKILSSRFMQAGSNKKNINYHGRGMGIGLTFVKCVAEIHGGSLNLVGSDEKGSTVELRIPIK